MLNVKILASGCANCKKLEAVASDAAAQLGIEAEFVKVTDVGQMLAYDFLATPALVIDEKVVCSGKIPAVSDVQGWMKAVL